MRSAGQAIVAGALLVAAAGCGGGGEPPPPVRLVEHAQGTEVRWPALGGAKPPSTLRSLPQGALEAPARLVELFMFGAGAKELDVRPALLAPPGAHYRFRLVPPARAALRLGLGYVVDPEHPGRRAPFRIRVRPAVGGDWETLLAEVVLTEAAGSWRDRTVSLAAYAGREIVLELAVRREVGGESQGVLWTAFGTPEIAAEDEEPAGPHVVLLSLDTLRADRLSGYGHERPTSPNLDALAAGGYRFATAVSQAPWTRPSHESLFTSRYPLSRRVADPEPLALALWRSGYRTGAMTGGGQVSPRFGFGLGFDSYRVGAWLRDPAKVISWLDEAPGRKTFLFLHTFEIHDPYRHEEFARGLPAGRVRTGFGARDWWGMRRHDFSAEERAYVEALYDGGVRFTDQALGDLFELLDRRGFLERAIVIVTSDHGEQFWEHGSWRHGATVHDHQVLVPLIVHLPRGLRRELGGGGKVIAEQVELVDLYPTLLDLLGLPAPPGLEGESLRPLLAGRPAAGERWAFAEHTNIGRESKTLRGRRWKLIHSFERSQGPGVGESFGLFDLTRDPLEQRNLAGEAPAVLAEMRRRLEEITGGAPAAEFQEEVPAGLDPALLAELEALGYVGD